MSRTENFYVSKLEWLGPIIVRGLRLLSTVDALGQEFSFSQVMVLETLLTRREMRMNDLATTLGLSKANATGLVDRLVRLRLIERSGHPHDRRVVLVRLTPAGVRAARTLVNVHRRGLVQLMKRIPAQDLDVFVATLERLAMGLGEEVGSKKLEARRRVLSTKQGAESTKY